MAERLVRVALALLVILVVGGRPAAAEVGAIAVDGEPCPDGPGVTVVIDFQELGDDTVLVRCAPDAPGDGFEALEQAGIPYRTTVAFPGFLCRIADRPDDDPCDTASPAEAYWSYWLAPAGGTWCYSNKGAGNRTPPPGAVEGWSFSLDKTAEDVPPPRHDPPGDPTGDIPLATDDCTTAAASSETGPGGSTAPATTGSDEAVGRGDPVDLDEVDEGTGSLLGTIAGVGAIALVAVAAVVLARRARREPAVTTEPVAEDHDRWRPASGGPDDGWSDALHPSRPGAGSGSPTDDAQWARPVDEPGA